MSSDPLPGGNQPPITIVNLPEAGTPSGAPSTSGGGGSSGGCATLNNSQLQQLAVNAGFSAALAPLMAAIAIAESGGCPTATNSNDNNGTQTSWGLWQISDGTHRVLSGWNDPQTNARLAFAKYQSQGLGAWGTYTSGAYKKYLSPGTSTTASLTDTLGLTMSSAPTSPTACVPWDFPCMVKELIQSDIFQRAGILFFGIALALAGILILFLSEGKAKV